MTLTEQRITRGVYAFFALSVVALVMTILFVVMAHAEPATPRLSYNLASKAFTLTVPEDATYGCIEWKSLSQADYAPAKCLNFEAGKQVFLKYDWSLINCTYTEIATANSLGLTAYCPDNAEWEIRGYTETPAEGSRVYTDKFKMTFTREQVNRD